MLLFRCVQIVRSPDRVTVPLELFEAAIDENTALVATSHVYFTSGAIQNVAELARIAHRKGALFLVDAYRDLHMMDLASNAEKVYAENYPNDTKDILRKRHWWALF